MGINNNLIGNEGDWLRVDSAHGVSKEWVEDKFEGNDDANGGLKRKWIMEQTGGDLFGKLQLRDYVIKTSTEFRKTPYKKRRATDIVKQMDFIGFYQGLPYSCTNSIDNVLEKHVSEARKTHLQLLGIMEVSSGGL